MLIITCSDQQIFTGGAYAITLRYVTGCSISAYHYNIVANMLLVTCATHLMAVAVTRNLWEHPLLGVVRVAVTALVFLVTGLLLSNQQAGGTGFPTAVPSRSDDYSDLLLSAACFQAGEGGFSNQLQQSLATGGDFFSGRIPGWSHYVVMCLYYIVAVLVRIGRAVRAGRRSKPGGRRARLIARLDGPLAIFRRPLASWLLRLVFGAFLLSGVAISGWTCFASGYYVFQLRDWLDKTDWINRRGTLNPENDPWSFGQLVPLLLMSLTLYTFVQVIAEQVSIRRKMKKDEARRRDREAQAYGDPPTTVLRQVSYNSEYAADAAITSAGTVVVVPDGGEKGILASASAREVESKGGPETEAVEKNKDKGEDAV